MGEQPRSMPVALAPTGLTGMQHADGEILAARAAAKAGVPFTLSTMSICSIEDVAENTNQPFWFQLYVMRDQAALVPGDVGHKTPDVPQHRRPRKGRRRPSFAVVLDSRTVRPDPQLG